MGSGGIGKKKQADVPADGGIDKVRLVYVELVHNNAPFEELFQIDFGGWRAFFRAVKDFAEDPTSALSECIATGILQKNGIAFKDWGKKVRERSPAFKEQFNRFIHLPAVRYALATDLGMDPAATDLTDADGRSGPGGPSMNPAAIRDRDRYEPANDSYDERAGAGGSQQPRRPYSPSEGGYTANADSSMPAESRYHARKRADPDSPTSPMLDRLEMLLSSSPVDGPDSPIERLQRTLDEKDPEPPRGTAALGAGPATARRQFAGAGYAAMAARSPPPPPTTTTGGGALDVDAAFAAATVTSPNGSVGGGVRNVSTPGVPGNLVQVDVSDTHVTVEFHRRRVSAYLAGFKNLLLNLRDHISSIERADVMHVARTVEETNARLDVAMEKIDQMTAAEEATHPGREEVDGYAASELDAYSP